MAGRARKVSRAERAEPPKNQRWLSGGEGREGDRFTLPEGAATRGMRTNVAEARSMGGVRTGCLRVVRVVARRQAGA